MAIRDKAVIVLFGALLICANSIAEQKRLPKDIATMVGDCMITFDEAMRVNREVSESLVKDVGEGYAFANAERSKTEFSKASSECSKRSDSEKKEIERRYAEEYGFTRVHALKFVYGDRRRSDDAMMKLYRDGRLPEVGAPSAFEKGGMLNPLHVEINQSR